MRTTLSTLRFGLTLAALVAVIGLCGPKSAHAQCTSVQVSDTVNNCGRLRLTLYDAAGNTEFKDINFMYGTTTWTFTTIGQPIGVVSAGGNQYAFAPAPPAFGCTPCIALPKVDANGNLTGGTCCVTVCNSGAPCGVGICTCVGTCQP